MSDAPMSDKASTNWRVAAHELEIREDAPTAAILRVRHPEAQLLARLGDALNVTWPIAPNTRSIGSSVTVSWLAPDEWLIVADGSELTYSEASVVNACTATLHHLVDMSDALRRWWIAGPRAEELLRHGCSLDLHLRVFPVNACARTILAQTAVFISRHGPDDFVVIADASLGSYMRAWMSDAASRLKLSENKP